MASRYDVGDTIRLQARFTDTGGNPIDPDSVTIMVRHPDESESSLPLEHPSSGVYYSDFTITDSGTYRWRVFSTGSLAMAGESVFTARRQWVGAST